MSDTVTVMGTIGNKHISDTVTVVGTIGNKHISDTVTVVGTIGNKHIRHSHSGGHNRKQTYQTQSQWWAQ